MKYRISITFLAFLSIVGCATQTQPTIDSLNYEQPNPQGIPNSEAEIFNAHPNGLDVGLSMSGGGIRSAMFQIGVLRALSEEGGKGSKISLPNIDSISAVSGGAYAAYWLYLNEYLATPKSEDYTFGMNSLGGDVFIEQVCSLTSLSNFVKYHRLLLSWITGKNAPDKYYEKAILRTFGSSESKRSKLVQFSDLQEDTRSGDIPYLILNGTIRNTVDPFESDASRYEFTPLHFGNRFGYTPWNKANDISINSASMISGAAVGSLLYRSLPSPPSEIYPSKVDVSDGGHSENLGAAALVTRGTKTIIVSDAEFDPNFELGSLKLLQKRLLRFGYTFDFEAATKSVRESPASVASFKLKHSYLPDIEILYIKMRYDKRMLALEISLGSMTPRDAWTTTKDLIKSFKDNNCRNASKTFNDFPSEYTPEKWLIGVTHNYAYYLNDSKSMKSKFLRLKLRMLNMVIPKSNILSYEFPHMTTADQSLYVDQSLALVGLGYLQAKALLNKISD